MKNATYLIILLFCFSLLVGCGADQYAIEKKYWYVKKEAEKIFKNPHASPPRELEKSVAKLERFVKDYPQNNLSLEAEFTIPRLFIVKKEFDTAREYLRALVDKYSQNKDVAAEAMFLIGNSYEIEDNWAMALRQYELLKQEYTLTLRGLSIPIYIAEHYKVKYEPDNMLVAFRRAASHYKGLCAKYPNSKLDFNMRLLIAQCYGEIKDWQAVIKTFDGLIVDYKDTVKMDSILMQMAMIYKNELKDNNKTIEALHRLIKDYPDSRQIGAAKKMLNELGG